GLFLFIINALLFWAASGLLQGFNVNGFVAALIGSLIYSLLGLLIAAAVIGLLNMIVRPVLVVLTLPVTIVTLGLFLFIINALVFWAASGLLQGFNVTGFVAALIGSLIYSLLGLVIEAALGGLFTKPR
ncbi:MAG: phage holin family protein, partial [Variovorax sp.]